MRKLIFAAVALFTMFAMVGCPTDDSGGDDGPIRYTVSFDVNGGTGATFASQTVDKGKSITLPAQGALVKSGFTFGGWNENAGGTGATHAAGTSYTPTKSIKLFAKWTEVVVVTYTVTFYADETTTTALKTVPGKTSGYTLVAADFPDQAAIDGLTPSTPGFTFGGWKVKNATPVSPVAIGTAVTANLDVVPNWVDPTATYIVTFKSDSGAELKKVENIALNGTLAAGDFPADQEKNGYKFLGWIIENSTTPFTTSTQVTADLIIVPSFVEVFIVTFEDDAGDLIKSIPDLESGDTVALTDFPTSPTKAGFFFDGWIIKGSDPETAFDENYAVTSSFTVVAKWLPLYSVTFEADDGTEITKVENIVAGGNVHVSAFPDENTLTPPSGKGFYGWIIKGSDPEEEFTSATVVDSDLTVVAKWVTLHTVTFKYDDGGATSDLVLSVATGRTVGAQFPAIPTKAGYKFKGWLDADEAPFTSSTVVDDDITVTAFWAEAFTVNFYNYEDGDLLRSAYLEDGETIENSTYRFPSTPNRGYDYMFKRWEDQDGNEFTKDTEVHADTDVSAAWYSGVFTGDTDDALEKVYVEDSSLAIYEFDLGGTNADAIAKIKALKGLQASYGVSEAAVAVGGPRLRVLGPYFFNGTEALELEKDFGGNKSGSKMWGDFKADKNGKLAARYEGNASAPGTLNKFQSYLVDASQNGWDSSADPPAANSWFTRTYNFTYPDPIVDPNNPNNNFSWGKTLYWLESILTEDATEGYGFYKAKLDEDGEPITITNGTAAQDYLDADHRVLPKTTDFTKVYFAIGLMRSNAGKVVDTTDNIWSHGYAYLVKDIKLILSDDSEVLGAIPSLSVPAHNYINDDDTTFAVDAITNTNQVFAGYINPVVGSWRGAVDAAITPSNSPGWEPPAFPPASTDKEIILTPADVKLYGYDKSEDGLRTIVSKDADTGEIHVAMTVEDVGRGAGITFDLDDDYLAYDTIEIEYEATIIGTAGKEQFSAKPGRGAWGSNLSGGSGGYPFVSSAGTGVFSYPISALGTMAAGAAGISFQINVYSADNVPQEFTIKFTKITLIAP
jgi:uncharacterized repeat protein (TIGR02543 family)